jgi:hypothetical protein
LLGEDALNALRFQLPTNIFVRLLAGPSEVREGAMGWALRAIAWATMVFAPVFMLVFFQLKFLLRGRHLEGAILIGADLHDSLHADAENNSRSIRGLRSMGLFVRSDLGEGEQFVQTGRMPSGF